MLHFRQRLLMSKPEMIIFFSRNNEFVYQISSMQSKLIKGWWDSSQQFRTMISMLVNTSFEAIGPAYQPKIQFNIEVIRFEFVQRNNNLSKRSTKYKLFISASQCICMYQCETCGPLIQRYSLKIHIHIYSTAFIFTKCLQRTGG